MRWLIYFFRLGPLPSRPELTEDSLYKGASQTDLFFFSLAFISSHYGGENAEAG